MRKPWMCQDPVHNWFELSYAQYLTVPRMVLVAMPLDWQKRFARCLFELDETLDWRPKSGCYWVKLKDERGRYASDPYADYRRPIKIPTIQEHYEDLKKLMEESAK